MNTFFWTDFSWSKRKCLCNLCKKVCLEGEPIPVGRHGELQAEAENTHLQMQAQEREGTLRFHPPTPSTSSSKAPPPKGYVTPSSASYCGPVFKYMSLWGNSSFQATAFHLCWMCDHGLHLHVGASGGRVFPTVAVQPRLLFVGTHLSQSQPLCGIYPRGVPSRSQVQTLFLLLLLL